MRLLYRGFSACWVTQLGIPQFMLQYNTVPRIPSGCVPNRAHQVRTTVAGSQKRMDKTYD